MKLKYFSWLPAAIVMLLIFCYSAKPAVSSNENSMYIANHILNSYEKLMNVNYEGTKRTNILNLINHIVRKGAHFSEYAVLACALAFHLLILGKKDQLLLLIPIVLAAFYASTDEYHQTFVAGRSGQVMDVLIDSSGAVVGATLFMLVKQRAAKRHIKKLNKDAGLKQLK